MSIQNNLNEIVNISIDIGLPASSDIDFNNILIIASEPDGEEKQDLNSVIEISNTSDLLNYGYTENHAIYTAVRLAFAQTPCPQIIYLIKRLKISGEYENIEITLERALSYSGWYGLALESTFADIERDTTIQWAEKNDKLFGFTVLKMEQLPKDNNYYRSYGVYAGNTDGESKENSYVALALMAKCFGYDPGSETWGLKELAGIKPSLLSVKEKNKLETANITYFTTYAQRNITSARGGKVLGNEWIDTIRFRDWIKNDMQEKIFGLLINNPKLPYTDNGITSIEGKIEESLRKGQDIGGIAEAEYDNDDNEIPGYTITIPQAIDISETQKASRILTGCKFTARLAGAIQVIDISGSLKY